MNVDGVEPDCFEGRCATGFDRLGPKTARIIEIHAMLKTLADLVDPGTICRMYHVDRYDLTLLAALARTEQEIRTIDGNNKDNIPG